MADSKLSIKLLMLRTAYATGCVLVDGVFLPWIVISLNRTMLSYAIFIAAFAVAVFLQVRFYFRWKGA